MLCFRKSYFFFSVFLLVIEINIALFAKDFLRFFWGDLFIVIFLYAAILSFVKLPRLKAGFGVLILAYLVEFMQYFNILDYLNLQDSKLMILLFGQRFDWLDILAYSLGMGIVLLMESIKIKLRKT